MSAQRKARILHALASLLGRLPWPLLYRLGDGVAALWRWRDVRESRVTRRNLELAFPELDAAARARLHRQVLRTTARQALETLKLWTRPPEENLRLLRERAFDAEVHFGEPIEFRAGMNRKEVTREAEARVRASLQAALAAPLPAR